MMGLRSGLSLLLCAGLIVSAAAQETGNLKPSASGNALLMRVDDGVFQLRQGQTIDLTDRKALLTFRTDQRRDLAERKLLNISISGRNFSADIGKRFDLKGVLDKTFDDKDECFLDVVDLVAPKGAPPTATFRLSCL